MRISLKVQYSVMVSFLLSCTIAAVSFYALHHEKKSLIEERLLRGKTLVRNLATASAEAILSDNELNLFSYCKDIVTNETDAQEVNVMAPDGRFIAHSTPEMVGKYCTGKECNSILSSTEFTIQSRVGDKATLISISSPMNVMDKKIGFVTVVMTNASIQKKINEVTKDIITLSIVAVLIGVLLTFILVYFLVVPIKRLSAGASIVGTGNFEHRINISSNNEVGELAQTFNSMAESLLRSKEQLASLNNTSRAINTSIELNEVIGKAMDAVESILRPQQTLLCLQDPNGLRIVALSGISTQKAVIGSYIDIAEELLLAAIEKRFIITSSFSSIAISGESDIIELQATGSNEKMILPLIYENSMKGFFIVNGKKDGKPFTVTDSEYLEIISSSATIALLNIELLSETAENARMQSELEMAETVQKTLFPDAPIVTEDVEVYGFFKSASETGGDWYYTLMDPNTRSLGVFIGDVTGHGVPAALNTATAYSFIQTLNLIRQNIFMLLSKVQNLNMVDASITRQIIGLMSPGYVLGYLNQILFKKSQKTFLMTFFSTLLDIPRKKLYFANAGHEMPLIMRADTSEIEPLVSSGVRLGDQVNASFEQKAMDVRIGDTIFWYTDGLIEGMNNEGVEYGTRRFYRILRKACSLGTTKDILDYCVNDFLEFTSGQPLSDDVTLVVAKILR